MPDEIVRRRFGPKFEKPCKRETIVECALYQCQEANECQHGIEQHVEPMSDNLTPESDGVTLAHCPIGLFTSKDGELCLKTEYGNNEGRIDAYIVSSGEFFWGSAPQTIASQRSQIVYPFDVEERLATAEREALEKAAGECLKTGSRISSAQGRAAARLCCNGIRAIAAEQLQENANG